jgi:major histocompatibility complex class I
MSALGKRMEKGQEFKAILKPGVVAHTFNPSTWEAEAGGFLTRLAWSTK